MVTTKIIISRITEFLMIARTFDTVLMLQLIRSTQGDQSYVYALCGGKQVRVSVIYRLS